MHTAPDETLMRAAAEGCEAAFGTLIRRHHKAMLLTAVSVIHNESDAEDLVQDVLVQIWNSAGAYQKGRGTVRAWVLTITRNQAINRLNSLGAYFRAVNRAGEHWARTEVQHQDADTGENEELLAQVLRHTHLDHRETQAFHCHFLLGMTDREASAHLGISRRSYQERLGRARLALNRARTAILAQ